MALKDLDDLLEEALAPSVADAAPLPPVLVVDDDPGVREALAELLRGSYDVILASSAKEGVSAVHDGVHAVILDVKMRRYDGFWACNEIRKRHPDMPIIFYSAYQNLKDPYEIINEHRPLGYIAKGEEVGKLLSAVDTAVRLSKIILFSKEIIASHFERRSTAPSG